MKYLSQEKLKKTTLEKLGKILKENPGKDRVIIIIPNGGKPRRLKLPYTVKITETLKKKIEEVLDS